jgi:hypothetical protein
MAYLIIWELPKYPETETGAERVVYSKRHHARTMLAYEDARAAIESVYPGRKVSSPLEFQPNALVLGVYLSPNKEGFGRIAGNFMLWGVERTSEP